MRIQGSGATLEHLRELARNDEASPKPRTPSVPSLSTNGAASDPITISPRAREVQRVREKIETSPDVRQALVDEVKQEIASGRYRFDGTRIANALLDEGRGPKADPFDDGPSRIDRQV